MGGENEELIVIVNREKGYKVSLERFGEPYPLNAEFLASRMDKISPWQIHNKKGYGFAYKVGIKVNSEGPEKPVCCVYFANFFSDSGYPLANEEKESMMQELELHIADAAAEIGVMMGRDIAVACVNPAKEMMHSLEKALIEYGLARTS